MFCWRGVFRGNGSRKVSRIKLSRCIAYCIALYCTLCIIKRIVIGQQYIQQLEQAWKQVLLADEIYYSSSFDFLEDLNQDPNLLPFSPPSFSFCNLSASFAFFKASLACALSEEFEKNEANPTHIERPPIWVPWGSSILSAIRARLRASLYGSAWSWAGTRG